MQQATDILDHVPAATLVVFRVAGLMIFGPLFGSSAIPPRLKVYLALVLGLAAYPLVGLDGAPPVPLSLAALAPLVACELAIGLTIGFLASMPLLAVQIGGPVMGQQMGLGFARVFNPAMEDDATVLSQVLFFLVLGEFILIGGHEAMLLAILRSFEHLPVPAAAEIAGGTGFVNLLIGLLTSATEIGLRVATPVLALLFLQTTAMGFIAKTVPQMNILSLGFPLRIIAGLGMVAAGLYVISEVLMEFTDHMLETMFAWIETL